MRKVYLTILFSISLFSNAFPQGDICDIPGFETIDDNFAFSIFRHQFNSNPVSFYNACNMTINSLGPSNTGPYNVNNNTDWVSYVTSANDPNLLTQSVTLQTVNTGANALRVGDLAGATNQIVTFAADLQPSSLGNNISFNMATVFGGIQNNYAVEDSPFIQILLLQNGVLQNSICYTIDDITNGNCQFLNAGGGILYQPWTNIIVPANNLDQTQSAEIRISVADGTASGNYGYIYLDDFCVIPNQGNIQLNTVTENCPNLPLEICGTYNLGTLQNQTLEELTFIITDQDGNETIVLDANPSQDGTFCQIFTSDDFENGANPVGNYQIEVFGSYSYCGWFEEIIISSNIVPVTFNNCPQPINCEDIVLTKQLNGFIHGSNNTFSVGDTVNYQIRVDNNGTNGASPVSLDVIDVLDTNVYDINSYNGSIPLSDNILTININDLDPGDFNVYGFSIKISNSAFLNSYENCATISIPNCDIIENCVNININQPDDIWPRTFGNYFSNEKNYLTDVVTDNSGNIYAVGYLEFNSESNEDSFFNNTFKHFLIKFDFFGNMIFIKDIGSGNNSGGSHKALKIHNNYLYILTTGSRILKTDLNGNILNTLDFNNGITNVSNNIEINQTSNSVYVTANYSDNYINPNDSDFNVNTGPSENKIVIFKLDENLDYLNRIEMYVDTSDFSIVDPVYFSIKDLECITSTKLVISGLSTRDIVNSNNGNCADNKFLMTITDDFLGFSIDSNNIKCFENNFSLSVDIEKRSDDSFFYNEANKIYRQSLNFSDQNLLVGELNGNERISKILYDHNDESVFYVGSYENLNSKISKFGDQSILTTSIWEENVNDSRIYSIYKNQYDYFYLTGSYFESTNFGNDFKPVYNKHDTFLARLQDDGSAGVYRNFEKYQLVKDIDLYPNPSKYKMNVISKNKNDFIKIEALSLGGKIIKTYDNLNSFNFEITVEELNSGVYFIKTYYKNGDITTTPFVKE